MTLVSKETFINENIIASVVSAVACFIFYSASSLYGVGGFADFLFIVSILCGLLFLTFVTMVPWILFMYKYIYCPDKVILSLMSEGMRPGVLNMIVNEDMMTEEKITVNDADAIAVLTKVFNLKLQLNPYVIYFIKVISDVPDLRGTYMIWQRKGVLHSLFYFSDCINTGHGKMFMKYEDGKTFYSFGQPISCLEYPEADELYRKFEDALRKWDVGGGNKKNE